jgi:membrane protein YdbS with pleckstrin-like domain
VSDPTVFLLPVVLLGCVWLAFEMLPDHPWVFVALVAMGLVTVVLLWLVREKPRRRGGTTR